MQKDQPASPTPNQEKWVFGALVLVSTLALLFLANEFLSSSQADAQAGKEMPEIAKTESAISIEKEKKSAKTYQGPAFFDFQHRKNDYTAFVFNTSEHEVRFYYHNKAKERYHNLNRLKKAVKEEGDSLLFATNAGIFDPQYRPKGLFISDGDEVAPLNTTDGQGNFFLKPNGVFFTLKDGTLGIMRTEAFEKNSLAVLNATESSPMLLIDGEPHPAFNEGSSNRYVRNGVGLISPWEAVFLISKQAVNLYDFSMAFKEEFQCQEALYLDGAISQIYLPGNGPPGNEQAFSGMIGIVSKKLDDFQ